MRLRMLLETLGLLVSMSLALPEQDIANMGSDISKISVQEKREGPHSSLVLWAAHSRQETSRRKQWHTRHTRARGGWKPWDHVVPNVLKSLDGQPRILHRQKGQRVPAGTLHTDTAGLYSLESNSKRDHDGYSRDPQRRLIRRAPIERLLHETPGYKSDSAISPITPAIEAVTILSKLAQESASNKEDLAEYSNYVTELRRKYRVSNEDTRDREVESLTSNMILRMREIRYHELLDLWKRTRGDIYKEIKRGLDATKPRSAFSESASARSDPKVSRTPPAEGTSRSHRETTEEIQEVQRGPSPTQKQAEERAAKRKGSELLSRLRKKVTSWRGLESQSQAPSQRSRSRSQSRAQSQREAKTKTLHDMSPSMRQIKMQDMTRNATLRGATIGGTIGGVASLVAGALGAIPGIMSLQRNQNVSNALSASAAANSTAQGANGTASGALATAQTAAGAAQTALNISASRITGSG